MNDDAPQMDLPQTGDYFHYLKEATAHPGKFVAITPPTSELEIQDCEVFAGETGLILVLKDSIAPCLLFRHHTAMKIVDALARFTMLPESPSLYNYIKRELNTLLKDTTDERK